jgi:hypothetical protein
MEAGATGLAEGSFYAQLKALAREPADPDAADPSDATDVRHLADPDWRPAQPTEPADEPDKGGDADEPDKADKADQADKPKKADEADEADDAKRPAWDKDRQRRDQELADLRKKLSTLEEAIAAANRTGQPPVQEPPAKGDEDVDLDAELAPLDEFATEAERNERFNVLVKRQRALEARQQKREAQADAETSQRANKEAYNRLLDECDGDFGAEFRNAAVERMREVWNEAGFKPGNFPDPAHTRLAVRGVYAELKAAKLLAQPKPTAKPKGTPKGAAQKPPASSSARGGRPSRITGGSLTETLDQTLDRLVATGRIRL